MENKELTGKVKMIVRGYREGDVTFDEALRMLGVMHMHCDCDMTGIVMEGIETIIHEKVSEIFA